MSDFSLVGDSIEVLSYGITGGTTNTVAVTAGSANVKGSWAEITAATTDDINGFYLDICSDTITVISDYLMDIGIGSAGNEEIIIPDILYSIGLSLDLDFILKISFPIQIPAGTRIAARVQSTTGSNVARVSIAAMPHFLTAPIVGQEVFTIGAASADSGGIQVDPGGTANTKGSYVEMTSSTSEDFRAIMILQGQQANTNQRVNRVFFDVAVGASSSEEIILPDIVTRVLALEVIDGLRDFIPVYIPAGTRLAIRAQSSDNNATDRLIDYVIYGLR